jgi:hypothetical protein
MTISPQALARHWMSDPLAMPREIPMTFDGKTGVFDRFPYYLKAARAWLRANGSKSPATLASVAEGSGRRSKSGSGASAKASAPRRKGAKPTSA